MGALGVEDFKFQVNDSPQSRAQKLEALRLSTVKAAFTALTAGDWQFRLSDKLEQTDTSLTPDALPKLTFGLVLTVEGQGDVFQFDGPKTLGTRSWLPLNEAASFRGAYRVRAMSGSAEPTVAFLLYSAEGRYLGAFGEVGGDPLTVEAGWVTYEVTATAEALAAAFPDAAYVRSRFSMGESNARIQMATARIENLTDVAGIEDAIAAAEAAAQQALDAALAGAGSAETAAGYANTASAAADAATGSAAASQASAVAAQSFADDAETNASASSTHASTAQTKATEAGASAAAADIARIAAEAANTTANTQAGIATTKAAAADASAAAALASQTLASTYAGNANTSATNAATSATNASGSAATATSQATLAASYSTGGGNLLPNSDFQIDTSGWTQYSATPSHFTWSRDLAGASDWSLYGEHQIGIRQINATTGVFAIWHSDYINVEPGKFYEFQSLCSSNRCQVALNVEWYDDDGVYLSSNGSGLFTPQTGGYAIGVNNVGSGWTLQHNRWTAPAGAMRARVILYKGPTTSGSDSYAWFTRPMLRQVPTTTGGPASYAPGNGRASLTTVNSSVISAAQAAADANSAVASLTNTVRANAGGNPNMVPNAGFENGLTGWTGSVGNFALSSNTEFGNYVVAFTNGTYAIASPSFSVQAGAQYTISADTQLVATGGAVYVDIIYQDAAGGGITGGDSGETVRGPGHFFTTDGSGRQATKFTSTAPVGAVKAIARFVVSGVTGISNACFRQIKVEKGPLATAYSNDVAVTQAFTAIAGANGNIATLTQRVDAGSNPNLLQNATFERGSFTGWIANMAGWGIASNMWGTYAYNNAAMANGAADYLYQDVQGIVPGTSYTASIEAGFAITGGAGYWQITFQWINASNVLISATDSPMLNTSMGFAADGSTRKKFTATAPAGTSWLRIVFYFVKNSGTLVERNIRLTKLEVGTIATPYSSEASVMQSFSAINGMYARWGVAVSVGGKVTGRVKLDGTGTTSSFDVEADSFSVTKTGGGARTEFANGAWKIWDASNVLRVQLGNLDV